MASRVAEVVDELYAAQKERDAAVLQRVADRQENVAMGTYRADRERQRGRYVFRRKAHSKSGEEEEEEEEDLLAERRVLP